MTNSSEQLEIYKQIIQESDLFVNLRDALVSLKNKLTGNDEYNVEIIEKWIEELPENDKNKILGEYEYYQLNVEKLGRNGKSSTKPGEQSEMLKGIIENAIIGREKPPESKKDA